MTKPQRELPIEDKAMDKVLMVEVMKLLQKKFGHIREISKLTVELGESVSRDDRVSAQMLINMRQEEMEKAEECDQHLYEIERKLPFNQRLEFENLTKGRYSGREENSFEIRKIKELCEGIHAILERTIAVDKTINRRISGEKSFYSTTKPEA